MLLAESASIRRDFRNNDVHRPRFPRHAHAGHHVLQLQLQEYAASVKTVNKHGADASHLVAEQGAFAAFFRHHQVGARALDDR
jgi:hypothetical protein